MGVWTKKTERTKKLRQERDQLDTRLKALKRHRKKFEYGRYPLLSLRRASRFNLDYWWKKLDREQTRYDGSSCSEKQYAIYVLHYQDKGEVNFTWCNEREMPSPTAGTLQIEVELGLSEIEFPHASLVSNAGPRMVLGDDQVEKLTDRKTGGKKHYFSQLEEYEAEKSRTAKYQKGVERPGRLQVKLAGGDKFYVRLEDSLKDYPDGRVVTQLPFDEFKEMYNKLANRRSKTMAYIMKK